MDIRVEPKGQKPLDAVRLARGADYQFMLKCGFPSSAKSSPARMSRRGWLPPAIARSQGVKEPVKDRNPLCFVKQTHRANLQIAAGLVGCLDLAPETLDQWVAVEAAASGDRPAIRIKANKKYRGHLLVAFDDDGQTPARIEFQGDGVAGNVVIRDWKLDVAVRTLHSTRERP